MEPHFIRGRKEGAGGPKSPEERALPPIWEPTTSNRSDCLNVEDESKHDLDSNDPIQIELTDVIKPKRKVQYLQSKVKDSQPTAENIASGKPRTTSARCLSESTNAISSTCKKNRRKRYIVVPLDIIAPFAICIRGEIMICS